MDSLMNSKNKKMVLIILTSFFISSCARLYNGSFAQPDFQLIQPDELGPSVKKWEDGVRTSGKHNEFEWWYFDAKLEDGSLFVCYFYKVHFIKDRFFIGMNYSSKDHGEIFKLKYFKKDQVSFSKDSCNVTMGKNYFIGNLKDYKITLSPDDFDGFGIDIELAARLDPYRPQDGIIKTEDDYFAWLAAVPDGHIDVDLTVNGEKKKLVGDGYHDHNWGNTPLQRLFDGWTWFRGKTEDHTIIAAELYTSDERGGYDIPILYIANEEDGMVVNRFGQDGLFTRYSDRIENLYNKNNEPYFSTIDILTKDGKHVRISGKDVIDNSNLFNRMGMPWPIKWIMNQAKIDPYYTRFNSELKYEVNEKSKEGFGVLEVMDLK